LKLEAPGRGPPFILQPQVVFPITSALPDQGPQQRWQNSTGKEGCQRHALWPAVFYRFFLIPDPCSSQLSPAVF